MRGLAHVSLSALGVVTAFLVLSAPLAGATATLPSGERVQGQSTTEPAYNDMTGQLIFIKTPNHAPFPVNSNNSSWAPLYIVMYPAGSTVGTLNCMGVPGNCPDHDGEVAGAATQIMPNVYGTNASLVPGHDHLLAAPGSGGDFNIAWQVILVLFTDATFANQHLTTLAQLTTALGEHQIIEVPTPIVFHCSVAPEVVYDHGTPVGA